MRKQLLIGTLALPLIAVLADGASAGFFHRRYRCACAPVYYYPCPEMPVAAAPQTPEEVLAEMQRLANVVNKPLAPLPKPSPAVEKLLGGPPK
jgi:hypothetical protein